MKFNLNNGLLRISHLIADLWELIILPTALHYRPSSILSLICSADRVIVVANTRRQEAQWTPLVQMRTYADKTKFIWLRTIQQLAKVNCQSVNSNWVDVQPSTDVTCLGVVFDSEMNFSKHIRRLPGRCFYQLRQRRIICRSLTADAVKSTRSRVHRQLRLLLLERFDGVWCCSTPTCA